MSKLLFYDTETTGLIHTENAIHQLSGLIVINNEIQQEFNYQIAPHEGAVIEEEALKISDENLTEEIIRGYPKGQDVHYSMLQMLGKYCNKFNKQDKFHLVGYNNRRFDDLFIRYFFVNILGDKYFGSWFWNDTIDVLPMAANYLRDERKNMKSFKLKDVASYLGIPLDPAKLHDATYDIFITKAIYDIVGTQKR